MKKADHQLTNDIKLLQKIVLIHDNKFLIMQRSESSHSRPLAWDLPGGNSEWPESLENKENLHKNDAVREIFEETGIELDSEKIEMENLVDFRTFFDAKNQVYSVIVGWKINLDENFDEKSVEISDEHISFKWIAIEELDDFDFGGNKGEFVKNTIRSSFGKIY